MWNRIKTLWLKFLDIFEHYSPENIIVILKNLLTHVIQNGLHSGNILIRILTFPVLLLIIIVFALVLGTKKLINNFFNFLNKTFHFLLNLYKSALKEADAFWVLAGGKASKLLVTERYLNKKLIEYVKYLIKKIVDDKKTIEIINNKNYLVLVQNLIAGFTIWLLFVLLAITITIVLLIIPFLVPVFKYVRLKKYNKNSIQNTIENTIDTHINKQ